MKWKDKLITIFAVGFVALLVVSMIGFWFSKETANFECEIRGIELINVSPNNCYDTSYASEMCPIPKDIGCKFEGTFVIPQLADIIINQMN